MSGTNVEDFIAYWQVEGESYFRHGHYDWMAGLLPAGRVLEIGCGVGLGTLALVRRGLNVLALEVLEPCLDVARQRLVGEGAGQVDFLQGDLENMDEATRSRIEAFDPEVVVCWLMGTPQDMTGEEDQAARQVVAAYRERLHRRVAQLATDLPGVTLVHLVDRTVIPWQAKDLGRDTLVRYHLQKTFVDLPFQAVRQDALYRKLEGGAELAELRRSHPSLKSVVPALASLLLHRQQSVQE